MDRLDALSVFVAVAEQESFVRAARRLGRSPAAVSRAVAALEERLGTRLLQRTTRAVSLTDAGRRHYERCRALLAEFEAIEAAATRERDEPQGLLAITAPFIFGRLHVLPVATEFLRAYPHVTMRFFFFDRYVSLVDEGMDLGVRIGPLEDSSLRATKVGSVTRGLYASPDYLERCGTPKSPSELSRHDCIVVAGPAAGQQVWSFGQKGARRAVTVSPRLSVTSIEASIDAALSGVGIARLLSYQTESLIREGRLTRILAAQEPEELPIHVVQPAGRHVPAKSRVFAERLVPALRAKFARR